MGTIRKAFMAVAFGSSLLFAQLPNPLGLPDPLHLSDSQGLPNPLNLPDPLGLSRPSQGPARTETRRVKRHHRIEKRRKLKKIRKHGQ